MVCVGRVRIAVHVEAQDDARVCASVVVGTKRWVRTVDPKLERHAPAPDGAASTAESQLSGCGKTSPRETLLAAALTVTARMRRSRANGAGRAVQLVVEGDITNEVVRRGVVDMACAATFGDVDRALTVTGCAMFVDLHGTASVGCTSYVATA